MSKIFKKSALDKSWWMVGLLISTTFHGLVIYCLTYHNDTKTLAFKRTPSKILIDLNLVDRPPIVNKSRVLANQSMRGRGKLNHTKNQEQHLLGETIPSAEDTSQNFKQENSQTRKKHQRIKDKPTIVKKKIEEPESENKNSIKTSKKPIGIQTENSLKPTFWFKEDDHLQLSTITSEDVPFYLEMKNLLQKQLNLYLNPQHYFNQNYIIEDLVSVEAAIQRDGKLYFKKNIKSSTKQPYLNYLITKTVDNPALTLTNLPRNFTESNQAELKFVFSIHFTGPPLKQWWMKWKFID